MRKFALVVFFPPVVAAALLFHCPVESPGVPLCAQTASTTVAVPPIPQIGIRDDNNTVQVSLTAHDTPISLFRHHYEKQSLDLSPTYSLPAENSVTHLWTFNGLAPGPTIEAKVGDVLHIVLRNLLPATISFFIAGIFNAKEPLEGGLIHPGLTKEFIIPLTLASPGTYRYFSSIDASSQVARGLFGTVIIREKAAAAEETPFDETLLVLQDYSLSPESLQIVHPSTYSPTDRAETNINGRHGNVLTVNGLSISNALELSIAAEEPHLLRIVNSCAGRHVFLSIPGARVDRVITAWHGTSSDEVAVPPGGTADVYITLPEEGKKYNLILRGEVDQFLAEPVTQTKQDTAGEGGFDQILTVVVAHNQENGPYSIVDMLLLPSIDGQMVDDQIDEAVLEKPVEVYNTTDFALPLTHCVGGVTPTNCTRVAWSFDISSVVPPDAELIEIGFLFEVLCQPGDDESHAMIHLYHQDSDQSLGRSMAICDSQRRETALDFHDQIILNHVKDVVMSPDHQIWFTATTEFLKKGETPMYAASRKATEYAPPTLRLLFKTKTPEIFSQASSIPSTRAGILAKRKQLEKLEFELKEDQENLKSRLQALYDRVKRKQHGGMSADYSSLIVQQLEKHTQLQKQQKAEEKRLAELQKNVGMDASREQLIKEVRHQLEILALQQKDQRMKLMALLESAANNDSGHETGRFRGAHNDDQLTDIERKAVIRDKQLYLQLYHHYTELVAELKHVRKAAQKLQQEADHSTIGSTVFKFMPSILTLPDEKLLTISAWSAGNSTKELPPARPLIKQMGNSTPKLTIVMALSNAPVGDSTGRIAMWARVAIKTSNVEKLKPGDIVLWELENHSLTKHTLYFHRAFIEIIDPPLKEESLLYINNGRFYGITIGPAQNSEPARLKAISVVPQVRSWNLRVWDSCPEYSLAGIAARLRFDVDSSNSDIIFFDEVDDYANEITSKYRRRDLVIGFSIAGILATAAGTALAMSTNRASRNAENENYNKNGSCSDYGEILRMDDNPLGTTSSSSTTTPHILRSPAKLRANNPLPDFPL